MSRDGNHGAQSCIGSGASDEVINPLRAQQEIPPKGKVTEEVVIQPSVPNRQVICPYAPASGAVGKGQSQSIPELEKARRSRMLYTIAKRVMFPTMFLIGLIRKAIGSKTARVAGVVFVILGIWMTGFLFGFATSNKYVKGSSKNIVHDLSKTYKAFRR
jgi:hypothetical protein